MQRSHVIGWFPEGLRSDGDVRWTRRTTRSGFKLVFSENAKVYILPRPLRRVMQKQWRVAKGQPAIWREDGSFLRNFMKKAVLCFLPPKPGVFRRRLPDGSKVGFIKLTAVYLVGYAIRVLTGAAVFVGTLRLIGRNNER